MNVKSTIEVVNTKEIRNIMKITDETIQKVLNTIEQNKSDDGVLMNVGGFSITDKNDAEYHLNMIAAEHDPSRYNKAIDILLKDCNTVDAELLEKIKAGFSVIYNDK